VPRCHAREANGAASRAWMGLAPGRSLRRPGGCPGGSAVRLPSVKERDRVRTWFA
jgi:hypothetical protein